MVNVIIKLHAVAGVAGQSSIKGLLTLSCWILPYMVQPNLALCCHPGRQAPHDNAGTPTCPASAVQLQLLTASHKLSSSNSGAGKARLQQGRSPHNCALQVSPPRLAAGGSSQRNLGEGRIGMLLLLSLLLGTHSS